METLPTHTIAKSTGFSLKCNMQSSQASALLHKGLWLAAAPLCHHQLHLQTLVTHINIYVPQIKPDAIAVHSGKFIIKLKREKVNGSRKIYVLIQPDSTFSAQPHNETM